MVSNIPKMSPTAPPIPTGLVMDGKVYKGPGINASTTKSVVPAPSTIHITGRQLLESNRPLGNSRHNNVPPMRLTGSLIHDESQAIAFTPTSAPCHTTSE